MLTIRKLTLKIFLISIPVLTVLSFYFIYDPFKVLYSYTDFSEDAFAGPNRDYVSTELFLRNNKHQKYNSFILGNSKSIAFLCDDWKKYLPQNSKSFHYDASNESLLGIVQKLRFIDQQGNDLENVLLVFDQVVLGKTTELEGAVFIKHPALNRKSWFFFHLQFVKCWFHRGYFFKFIDYKLFGKFRSYMEGFFNDVEIDVDPITNDLMLTGEEDQINTGTFKWYDGSGKKRGFETFSKKIIKNPVVINYLMEIANLFKKHKTRYKIIFPLSFDFMKTNPDDIQHLTTIFGKENIFDFSGKNEFSIEIKNFYDEAHSRPRVGKKLLDLIYKVK